MVGSDGGLDPNKPRMPRVNGRKGGERGTSGIYPEKFIGLKSERVRNRYRPIHTYVHRNTEIEIDRKKDTYGHRQPEEGQIKDPK